MAFGQEEVERRRQQREALREKREQEQQAFKNRLTFAGAALAVAAVIILIVVVIGKSAGKEPTATTQPTMGTASAETAPLGDTSVVHFAAAGDLNITDKVVASGGVGMDYTKMIGDVLPLLAEADLTVMNFEGNVVGPPYGSTYASAPSQLLDALATAGVDMLQMANSRSISNGIIGLSATLQAIRAAGIEPIGAYATNEDFRDNGGYTIWQVQGVRIAVVAFTKGMDNMALPVGSEKCVNLLYTDYSSTYVEVDTEGITDILQRVEKEKPDITIALVHWGSEFNDTHSTSQLKIRDLMLENGVDAILGTHPHYVQEVEFNQENGTVVAYSLGDFISDRERAGTEYGIVLDLEITKDNSTGTAKITGCTYSPIFTCQEEDGQLRVVRIQPAIEAYEGKYLDRVSTADYESMKNALNRIADRVKPK